MEPTMSEERTFGEKAAKDYWNIAMDTEEQGSLQVPHPLLNIQM